MFLLLIIISKIISISSNQDVKQEFNDYLKNLGKKNKDLIFNNNPFFTVTGDSFSETHKQLLFSGNVWDIHLKTMFERDGIKTIEPIPLNDRNQSFCSSKMLWLQKMFFSNIVKLNPLYSVELKVGETVGLKCPFCNINSLKTKLWFKKRFIDTASFENLIGDMHPMEADNRIIILSDHTLVIKNFRNEDTGTYFCIDSELYLNLTSRHTGNEVKKEILKAYYPDEVFENNDEKINEVKNYSNETALELIFKISYNVFMTDKIFEKERLIINSKRNDMDDLHKYDAKSGLFFEYKWGEWGYCSRCGKIKGKNGEPDKDDVGIQKRFGDCRVKYNLTTHHNKVLKKLNRMYYPFGWPCNFGLHEEYVSTNVLVEIPADVVQIKDCTANCSVEEEKRRRKGLDNLVLEIASDKLNKMYYEKEDEERLHKVEIVILHVHEGSHVELHCPRTNIETNVVWRRFQQILGVEYYHQLDEHIKHRYTISSLNILHIKDAKEYDSSEIDCLVSSYIHGVFHLNVIPKNITKYAQSHLYRNYDILFGIWFSTCFIISILILCWKCSVYKKFLKSLEAQKISSQKFDDNVDKYIEINLTELIKDYNNEERKAKTSSDETEYYGYDDIVDDKVNENVKKFIKK